MQGQVAAGIPVRAVVNPLRGVSVDAGYVVSVDPAKLRAVFTADLPQLQSDVLA